MTVHRSTWKFVHDGLTGLFSTNRASTDAVNALVVWASRGSGRSFECLGDGQSPRALVATLETRANDALAAIDLEAACIVHGVARRIVPARRRSS